MDDRDRSDDLGRRAAAQLVADVDCRIDVDAALAQLHRGPSPTLLSVGERAGSAHVAAGRRRMQWLGAAAVAAGLITGGVALSRRDGPHHVAPSDTVPPATSIAPSSTVSPTVAMTSPSTTSDAATSTTDPLNRVILGARIIVDGSTPTLAGDVVATIPIASTNPWLGAVTPTGRIFVEQNVPGAQLVEITSSGLVDTGRSFVGPITGGLDERIYTADEGSGELTVLTQQSDGSWSSAPVGQVGDVGCSFEVQPDGVTCGSATAALDPPVAASRVEWERDDLVTIDRDADSAAWIVALESTEVTVNDCDGAECQQYVRATGTDIVWTPSLYSAVHPLARFVSLLRWGEAPITTWLRCGAGCQVLGADANGIITVGYASTDSVDPAVVVRRFSFADIEASATPPDSSIDALAGFPEAPHVTPSFDSVPLLLPSTPVPGATSALRTEGADSATTYPFYTQTWIASGDDGVAMTITTNLHQGPSTDDPTIVLAPWDRVLVPRMADGYAQLQLQDPSGLVVVWATGLTLDDLMTAARSMTLRPDGRPGWDVAALPPRLNAVHEGWYLGAASRSIRWSDGAQTVGEMQIVHGVAGMFTTPLGGATTRMFSIGGSPAVAYALGDRSAVVWSPAPDVTVLLGYLGSVDTAIELATSVQPVDRATWLAASDVAPPDDGCGSMFC